MKSRPTASEKGICPLVDTLKHVRLCLKRFEVEHGRTPQTADDILEVKNNAQQMDMIARAMIGPEFLDPEVEWNEA